MSWDISLRDPVTHKTIELSEPHFMRGGLYQQGGTKELWLNVTWNYGRWYHLDGLFPSFPDDRFSGGRAGIRSIYGMTGAESIPVLEKAIAALEARTDDISGKERAQWMEKGTSSYWIPTRENAIKPLHQLLAFAKMRPDGVWDGD